LVLGFTKVPRAQVGKHVDWYRKEVAAHVEHFPGLSGWHAKQSAWRQGVQTPAWFVN